MFHMTSVIDSDIFVILSVFKTNLSYLDFKHVTPFIVRLYDLIDVLFDN